MTRKFSAHAAGLGLLLAAAHTLAAAADTPIYAIQGSGSSSPYKGQTLTTTGVVTKLNSNGYFLQDLVGDNNPLTSDGVFVYTGGAPGVSVGQYLRITGTVSEFNVGSTSNADTLAHPLTELTGTSVVNVLGTGYSMSPTVVNLPELGNDDLEHYEGMLVTISGPFTVGQNYFLARYGQLTLSVGGRMETPSNRYRPGAQLNAYAAENARRRIILDDSSSVQNPNPTPYLYANGLGRGGDTVASLTGVIDYGLATSSTAGFGDYKLHPTVVPVFVAGNPRDATPPKVGGNIKVAAFNVLNYFTTFTNGQTVGGQTGVTCVAGETALNSCRGASNLAEFTRQQAKIVAALASMNADAVGLMEIQNNGNVAQQNLVDALNARVGAGTYAAVPTPAAGSGTDAIKVAMIYKPARLSAVGVPRSDTDPINNRPTLAQTFAAANGERFTVMVNHLKSKSSCPGSGADIDIGDGQGCWNAQRLQQAQRLRTFVAQVQASSGSNDVVLVGDFNAYAKEDPIYELTSNGYVDQIAAFNPFSYSYTFDGAAGYLDSAISTGSMAGKVAGSAHWHINADESVSYDYNFEFKQPNCSACAPDPYKPDVFRSSDHDPVLLGLNLYKTFNGSSGRDSIVGTAGDDLFNGGPGADTLTGNGGSNVFVYGSVLDGGDTITDFKPGVDLLDFRTLLRSLGVVSANPIASGHVVCLASGSNAVIAIDPDGAAGAAAPRSMVLLKNVACANALQPENFSGAVAVIANARSPMASLK